MRDGDAFTGSVPELYDTHLARLLFQPFADDLAARLEGFSGELLEIAAGTGIVTRALDAKLAPEARVTATDLNPPMLEHAARRGFSDRVTLQPADGQDLPFADEAFDAAVCQFGVMFFPDRVAGYREARRVLRPRGLYIASVWDRLEVNEVTREAVAALAAVFPENPPSFMSRTPHGYADPALIRSEVAAAGLTEVTLQTLTPRGEAASAWDAAVGLCQGTPLRGEIEPQGPDALDRATEAVAERLLAVFGEGPITGGLSAHLVTARR